MMIYQMFYDESGFVLLEEPGEVIKIKCDLNEAWENSEETTVHEPQ